MKQYNIPLGGYKPVENITYLLENDLSQINKIPFLQNYRGCAIVTVGNIYLDKIIDIEKVITDQSIITNKNKNIFIINCEHVELSNKSLVSSQYFNADEIEHNNSLDAYFIEKSTEELQILEEYQYLHENLKQYCYMENIYEN